ncbi:hypothetical protein PFLUV_G00087080 [Perca fluviatilis]|uniref:Uncharacterized protein n=1 Tax=Perca fluviatilis TaxID=8168 RepID=A0A6A5FBP9_PERFL|nr:hypothetical protein PFLUV_G00087080 [Perca fluviatilis]
MDHGDRRETEEQNKKVCHSTQSIHTAVCVINSVMCSLTSLGRCLSSKQTNLCVRKTVSSLHTVRGRERTLNAQTTQIVIQQKSGSIKS